jgi:hypothetical protein
LAALGVVMVAVFGVVPSCVHTPPATAVAASVAVVMAVLPTQAGAWSAPAAGFTQAQFGIVILTVSLQPAVQIN